MGKMSDRLKAEYKSYRELPITPLIRAGISRFAETPWHLHGRPEVDQAKCIGCRLCWLYCPEGVIKVEGGRVEVDYARCKGCGICANECPVGAITMVLEAETLAR